MVEPEIMIAGVQRQSDVMSNLVRTLECKAGLENMDVQYFDVVLREVEAEIRMLRKNFVKYKKNFFRV